MECPYCKADLGENSSVDGEYFGDGYRIDGYWEEWHCICPKCGKEFRWFENYIRVEDEIRKMEE